jgi:hypothetical protein
MGQERFDVQFPRAEENRINQAVAVMTQAENQDFANHIDTRERGARYAGLRSGPRLGVARFALTGGLRSGSVFWTSTM